MSVSPGKTTTGSKISLSGQHKSPPSERSRSSSFCHSLKAEANNDLEGADSEFHLASYSLEEKEAPKAKDSGIKKEGYASLSKKNARASFSGIPLPLTAKTAKKKNSKQTLPKAVSIPVRNPLTCKHTLEVQFLNKTKRFAELKKELIDIQKPVIETYQSLVQIKQKLGELGKCVKIDEVKLVSFDQLQTQEADKGKTEEGGDAYKTVKLTIEAIPKTLNDVCRNLLSRRSAIVEILETINKAEFASGTLDERIKALKNEGQELEKSLDVIISQNETKTETLLNQWQKFASKQLDEAASEKVDDLEMKVRTQEQLLVDTQQTIADLQKRLDDKKSTQDKIINELEHLIKKHEEKIKKLESDLETEKKSNHDHKNRNATSVQTIKSLKIKITDLEAAKRDSELKHAELMKKLSHEKESMKLKELNWNREKEDLNKNIRQQENLLHKLQLDRNHFETRYRSSEETMSKKEKMLSNQVDDLNIELDECRATIERLKEDKLEVLKKCDNMETFLKKMGDKNKEHMEFVSGKIDWGKSTSCSEAELLADVLAAKVEIKNYEDKLKASEDDIQKAKTESSNLRQELEDLRKLYKQKTSDDPISRYQLLLEESEKKLNEKVLQISNLQAEIRHLKMRQNVIDEQNENCPTSELMRMVDEGKSKMSDLIRKSMENDQKLHDYELMVEKQQKQMIEMENLLKMRNGLLGIMKSKKDELQLEKESLTRYSNEMRSLLYGIKEDLNQKSEQIKELSVKLENKERTCNRLEKKISELEQALSQTNEQRFKLQDTIGMMEKELQSTKAQMHQITDGQSRYEIGIPCASPRQNHDAMESFKLMNYQPQFMSQALYGMSMKNICSIRARVEELNNIKLPTHTTSQHNSIDSETYTSVSSSTHFVTNKNDSFEKILQLKAKRCEILQERADQSHDDLNAFLRMLTPTEKPLNDSKKRLPVTSSRHSSINKSVSKKFTSYIDKLKPKNDFLHQTRSCHNIDNVQGSSTKTLKDLTDTINSLKESLKSVEQKMQNDSFKEREKN